MCSRVFQEDATKTATASEIRKPPPEVTGPSRRRSGRAAWSGNQIQKAQYWPEGPAWGAGAAIGAWGLDLAGAGACGLTSGALLGGGQGAGAGAGAAFGGACGQGAGAGAGAGAAFGGACGQGAGAGAGAGAAFGGACGQGAGAGAGAGALFGGVGGRHFEGACGQGATLPGAWGEGQALCPRPETLMARRRAALIIAMSSI